MKKESFKVNCESCHNVFLWTPIMYKVTPKCPKDCKDKKGNPIQLSLISFDPVRILKTQESVIIVKDEIDLDQLETVNG